MRIESCIVALVALTHLFHRCFQLRYDNQSANVDLVFPPHVRGAQTEAINPEYNDFGFWRLPLTDTPIEVEAAKFLAAYADSSSSRKRRPSPGDKK